MKELSRLVFVFIFFSCAPNLPDVELLGMNSSRVLLLENLQPTSPLISFAILENESIVAINEGREIIRYSKEGNQINIFSNFGKGEFELSNPSNVESFMNGYVIWDANLLKMVEFNDSDEPVKEYKGFDHSIKGFKVDKNYIYTYINPLPNEPFIQVYDKKLKQFNYKIGAASNADVLANLNNCAGGMTFFKGDFVFIPSSKLEIFRVDTANIEKIEVSLLKIPDLNFKEVEKDPVNLINTQRQKAFELSMSSTILTGIYDFQEKLLVTGETGRTKLNGSQVDLSDRKQFFLFLNEDMDILNISFTEFDFNAACKLWKGYNESFFRIIKEEGSEEFEYYLEKLSITD